VLPASHEALTQLARQVGVSPSYGL
jgi:hypothetical protein